jgi:thiamine-monophosphate kinase
LGLSLAGEFDFIQWLRAQQTLSPLVQLGAGDDLAVLKWPADDLVIVGVDQVLDGVHFDSAIHTPRQIGRKVINRNLSDCAAMACVPAAAVATVALPKGSSIDYAKELYLGLRDAADPFDCAIVGGDTATWTGKLVLTVTILGRSAGVTPITRGGAKVGDGIYVTGPLGGSILGRHMTFEPRVLLGRALGQSGVVTAMIDISDGLSRDLSHICAQSNVGAVLQESQIPIHDDARKLSERDGVHPLLHALNDGEDHELLFTATAPPQLDASLLQPIRIGTITAEKEICLEQAGKRSRLEARGWEHSL